MGDKGRILSINSKIADIDSPAGGLFICVISSGGSYSVIGKEEKGKYVLLKEDHRYTPKVELYSGATMVSSAVSADNWIIDLTNNSANVYEGGFLSQTAVSQGGVLNVSYGGLAQGNTVNFWGQGNVFSGGIISSNTINSGGAIILSNGGHARDSIVNSSGGLNVYSGGVASSTTVKQGGFFGIGGGATAYDTTIDSAGALTVWGGGVISRNTINTWGAIILSSGATAVSTTIKANGGLNVYSGAVASDTTIKEGGFLGAGAGAAVYNTTADSNCSAILWGGCYAEGLTVKTYAHVDCLAGAKVNDVKVWESSGVVIVEPLGSVTVEPLGSVTVRRGINSEDIFGTPIYSSGGFLRNVFISGQVSVQSDSITSSVTSRFESGMVAVEGNTYIDPVTSQTVSVSYGGAVNGASIGSAGALNLLGPGCIVQNTTIYDGGKIIFPESGGINLVELSISGSLTLPKNCSASASYVFGSLTVNSGAVVSSNYINGKTVIDSGGSVNYTEINPQATLLVSSGGKAKKIKEYGGCVFSFNDSGEKVEVDVLNSSGGSITFLPNTFSGSITGSNTPATVHSGTSALNVSITSGGSMYVYGSGYVSSATVSGGGMISAVGQHNANASYHWYGAVNSVTLAKDGSMHLGTITSANNITISSGGKVTVAGGFYNSSYGNTIPGGSVCSVSVEAGGKMEIYGVATNIKENGGYVSVESGASATFLSNTFSGSIKGSNTPATVHSGTRALNVSITSVGSMYVYDGGYVSGATVSGGGKLRVSGGRVYALTANSVGAAYVYPGGYVADATINRGGDFWLDGGSAGKVLCNSGWFRIYSGSISSAIIKTKSSTDSRIEIFPGGVISSLSLESGGYLALSSGGTIGALKFEMSGTLSVGSGANVKSATVNQGGLVYVSWRGQASNMEIENGGKLNIVNSGYVSSANISSGGIVSVSSNGSCINLAVSSGGSLTVGPGGSALSVTSKSGAIISIDPDGFISYNTTAGE